MTRYNFYNNLELFHKTKEIIQQEEQEKVQEDLSELKHYGTKGQKWGVRKWQNYDGTFNEAGKERYFGKSSKTTVTDEDKAGSARSDVKDYLKFRNKMLKQRTRDDLNKWYRDNNKAADKQLLKDAKRVDKQREKMYKNQLKDFYDDPNELVSDLDRMYKIGSSPDNNFDNDKYLEDIQKQTKMSKKDFYNFNKITEDISKRMIDNASKNKGEKFREEDNKLEEELLNVPTIKKHFDEMKKIYEETGDWNKAEEYYWKQPELSYQDTWILNAMEHHVDSLWDPKTHYRIGSSPKEAKKLAKEAKELEKEFTTTSKYDSSYKYLDSDKIEKWLDKEENKAVEKAYADAMETAFGDTSKELHKLFKDYDDNEDEYVAKAAICDSLDYYDNLGDISSEVRWFIGDDGDQGSRNSHAYYLNEKGYNEKQINDKLADAEKAMNEGYEVGKKLSQYYNPIIPHMSDDLQKKVYNQIHYRWEKSDDYSYNKLLNAAEGLDFDKNNMKTADNFAKNLKPSCGNDWNGWMYFNKAVDNLGMNNTSYKDLSQADWDRINAEINKLKK